MSQAINDSPPPRMIAAPQNDEPSSPQSGNLEPPKPAPTGRWCPNIDAEAIYRVANGQLSLRKPLAPATEPLPPKADTLPLAEAPAEGYQPRQPQKRRFDAADIFQLSRSTHPWQAAPIEKPTGEAEAVCDEPCDDIARAG